MCDDWGRGPQQVLIENCVMSFMDNPLFLSVFHSLTVQTCLVFVFNQIITKLNLSWQLNYSCRHIFDKGSFTLSKFIELQPKNVLLICFNSILIIRSLAGNAFPTSSTPGSGAGQTSTRTSFVVPRAAILRSTSRPIPFASILTTMSEMSVSESIFRLSHFTKVIQLAFKLYWRPGLLKYLGL